MGASARSTVLLKKKWIRVVDHRSEHPANLGALGREFSVLILPYAPSASPAARSSLIPAPDSCP